MSELTPWATVHHLQATDTLRALVGKANSFDAWPPESRDQVLKAMKAGVDAGHVPADYDAGAIVGTASFSSSGIELRTLWEPPK